MPKRNSPIATRGPRALLAALLIGVASLVAVPTSLGAATKVAQKCSAPASTDQAGRQTFSPGINGAATVQTVTAKVHLFGCTGAPTGGSGMLRTTLKTAAVSCSVFSTAHVWNATATIVWKNAARSTGKVAFTTSGASRRAAVTGTITTGLFAGHTLKGEFKWVPVISPGKQKFPAACDNEVAVGDPGRISVVGDIVFRTQAFTIT